MSQENVITSNPVTGFVPTKVFTVTKRNSEVVDYDVKKIVNAVSKCFSQTNEGGEVDAMKVAIKVDKELNYIMSKSEFNSVYVEKIQDLVEEGPKNLSPYKKYFGGDNSTEAEMIRKKKKTLANKDIRTGRFAHN